jgi:hypothetical protein
MNRKHADLVGPALLLFALVVAFFAYFVRPGLVDEGRGSLTTSSDFHGYFLPRFIHGSKALLGGDIPLWNRFESGGMPFLATMQPATFYPPKLIYGFLPPAAAHFAFLVAHYLLAAGAFFVFLAETGLGGVGAFVGAAVWVFSTPILASNYHPVRIASLVWMPVVFLLAKRAANGERRAIAALALVVTFQIFAGYPEFSLDLGLMVAVHAAVSWKGGEWSRPPWRTFPWLGAAFALGAVGAAVQLLPLAEIAGASKRANLASSDVTFRALVTLGGGPLLLAAPGVFGFALVSVMSRRARPALVGSLACFFIGNGGWRLLRLLPGFGMVRFPFVWVYFATFYFAWMVAVGCDEFLRPEGFKGVRRAVASSVVAINGALMATLWAFAWWRFHASGSPNRWWPNITTPLGATLGIASGVWLIVAVAAYLRGKSFSARSWLSLSALVMLAHLAAFPFGATPSPYARPSKTGEIARFVARTAPIAGRSVSMDDILYGYPLTDRLPSPLGVENSFLPWRQRGIVERLGFIPMLGKVDWEALGRARGYLNAMDVELIVAPSDAEELLTKSGLTLIDTDGAKSFFRNPDQMGHAWVNFAARYVSSETESLDYFLGSDFDPHREVLLEAPTKRAYPEPSETLEAAPPVAEHRHSGSSIEWEVDLPRPGIFVVSDSAYPGWTAKVDDQPADWVVADYCLRAVELGSGRHRVRFDYRPKPYVWGARVSLVTLAGILIALLVPRRKKDAPAVPS